MAEDELELAEATTKKEADGEHPASDYAYVPDAEKPSTWKLRIDTAQNVGGAVAALGPKGYRGQKVSIPVADRKAVKAKVRAAWKKFHPDAKPGDVPASIAEADATGNPSFEEESDDIRSAWEMCCRAMTQDNPWVVPGYSSYPVETYEDHIIVRAGEDCWSIPFSRTSASDGADPEIVFDVEQAQKVERRWIVTEAEAEDTAERAFIRPIAEASGSEPTGSEWEVEIIRAGASRNGKLYETDVLKQAVPLFEGVQVLTRSDEDHVAQRNKTAEKVVGWIDGAKWNGKRKAVTGILHVSEAAAWLKTMLLDAWKRGKKDLVGLSIAGGATGFKPVVRDGKRLQLVEGIAAVSSVDVVVSPAAGGGFLKLVAAQGEEKEESTVDPKLIAALQEAEAAVVRALLKPLSEADVEALKKDHPELAEKIAEAMALPETKPADKPEPETKPVAEAEENEDEDTVPAALSDFVVDSVLGKTKLPEVTRKKIAKRFAGKAFLRTALSEAVDDEVAYFGELESADIVHTAGEGRTAEVGLEEAQRAKAALDGFFLQEDVEIEGQKVPRYRGIRQAYIDLTGDAEISGRLPRRPSGKLGISEADGGFVRLRLNEMDDDGSFHLSEAIDNTQFSNILGDSITRRMVREYRLSPLRARWEGIVDIVDLADFRTQRRERFGEYGALSAVAEGGDYVAITSPDDEEVTYAPTKRGNLESVTLEAIMNNDVGAIQAIPRRIARAGARGLMKFVLDKMRLNSVCQYDSVALAAAGHGNNISTSALSAATLATAKLTMVKQTDISGNEVLELEPAYLYVPPELEQLAWELTVSEQKPGTADNEANYIRSMSLTPVRVGYWSDTNNWWVTASKDQTPLMEVGFVFGEEPEILTQDMPNVGSMFNSDKLTYRVRHVYGGAVVDHRGFFGGIVA